MKGSVRFNRVRMSAMRSLRGAVCACIANTAGMCSAGNSGSGSAPSHRSSKFAAAAGSKLLTTRAERRARRPAS